VLKKVIPKDVEAKDIKTEFGQNWIDKKYFSQFIEEKMGFQRYKLSQSDITSSWFFEGYSYSFPYKASKVNDEKIVLSALNSKQIRVTYKGVVSDLDKPNMGAIMKELKTFGDSVDMKAANVIIKEILG
jgi:N12 class adenine-specific DNA methylase